MTADFEVVKKDIIEKSRAVSDEKETDFDTVVSKLRVKTEETGENEKKDNVIHDRYEGVLKNINTRTDLPQYLPLPGKALLIKRAIFKLINFAVTPRNIEQNKANGALRDGVKAAIGHNREQEIRIAQLSSEVDELKGKINTLEKMLAENLNSADEIRVFQFTSTLRRGDGVGNDVLAIHKYLKEKNVETRIFYESVVGSFPNEDAASIKELVGLRDNDILLVHVAFAWDFIEKLAEMPGRTVFVYHNITPPEFFVPYDEVSAEACKIGLEQVKSMKNVPVYCMADSAFNKNDLVSYGYECPIDVLPIIIPFEDYDKNADEDTVRELDDGLTNVLFVGRIAPNKKQEDIIRAFACYQNNYNPDSRLILLGGYDDNDLYYRSLEKYVEELGVKNVRFTKHIPFEQVIAILKSAHIFVCLSEHEGFCIPLLEAMHFEIPIIAFNSTAVGETMGNGGILFDQKDPATIATAIDTLLKDETLRNDIKTNQQKRLEDFSYKKITERFWELLVSFEPKLGK